MASTSSRYAHKKRVSFDRAQNCHRGGKQRVSHEHRFSQIPYGRVYRQQNRFEDGRKGPSNHFQPLQSTKLQPYHQRESLANRGDDSNFKTLLLKMIVEDLQPLNTVTGVLNLARSLQPSSHIELNDSLIQTELQSLYRNKRSEIQNEVNAVSNVALSAELWSSTQETFYLTVSCHIITENWIQKSYVLDTAHLLNKQTPECVLEQLLRISDEWNITEKIQVVVTNVDRMKKVQNNKCRWIFTPCFAHTLDTVFRETICESDLKPLLRKCQQIVAFFQQNNKATEILRKHCSILNLQQIELIQANELKWLSTHHMINSVLKLWPAIFRVFIEIRVEDVCLNENERTILKDIVAALDILKAVLEEIGSKEYSSISNIIPLVHKLQEQLKILEKIGNSIAQVLSKRCDYHMGNIKQNSWFKISTALDPRYKAGLLYDSAVKAEIRTQISENTHIPCSGYDTRSDECILEKYWNMNISENPLQFWRTHFKFKQMATVARRYLTVVSTAIPMKRVHKLEQSQAINRRNNLELKNLSMMLFLNTNYMTI